MKKNYLLLFIIGTLFIGSCTKKDTQIRLSEFKPPTITGFNWKDVSGSNHGPIGIPNIKLGNESNELSSPYYFSFYPNPGFSRINVYVRTPRNAEIKKIWITQAIWANEAPQELIGLNNAYNMTVGGSPLFHAEFIENAVSIDLSRFADGYYRIYLQVNGHLLYDNLVIYKSKELW